MAGLSLRHIYKIYQSKEKEKKRRGKKNNGAVKRVGDFLAVKDFNMEIKDGEFIVFVGPSGCGKSTTLRMIAGLEDISAGDLYIGDRLVNDVEPKDRDIAMVFQNYALYPHMTAGENIAFGLKMRKVPIAKKDENGNPVLAVDKKKISEIKSGLKTVTDDLQYAEESDTALPFKRRLRVLKAEYDDILKAKREETETLSKTPVKDKHDNDKKAQALKEINQKYNALLNDLGNRVNDVVTAQKHALRPVKMKYAGKEGEILSAAVKQAEESAKRAQVNLGDIVQGEITLAL